MTTTPKTNGWEFHDLEVEMRDASMSRLFDLYKRETNKMAEIALQLFNNRPNLTQVGIEKLEERFNFHEACKHKVALKIADMLTK